MSSSNVIFENKSTLLEGQVSEEHEQGATVCVLKEIIALYPAHL